MNDLNEHAARLELLLKEGLRMLNNWRHMPAMSAALIDWRHEAETYLHRHQAEALERWENNRGEPTDEQVILQDAQDQLRNYNQ